VTLTRHFTATRQADGLPWQVLAGGDRTDGQVVFGEAEIAPRSSGPGLHVHTREDEAVYVFEGVLTVRVGQETFEAAAGTLVWLPRGEPHTFANLSEHRVRAFGVITPAGLEGMFRETEAYLASLAGPPDPQELSEIGARYGVTALGPGLL
jgi:mannose-6-phosphate isomerase-like protein (cupin superfamily)